MKKLRFSITISAPKEKVWDTMLNDATYREWTSVFNPGGSYYKGSWKKGSKMLFLGPGEHGIGGMVSRIQENRPHEYISIEHVGVVQNGKEDIASDRAKQWTGVFENYTFTQKGGATRLLVDIDMVDEYANMFREMWPKALRKLKKLTEHSINPQGTVHNGIQAYNKTQKGRDREICNVLAAEISRGLPRAEGKIWHRTAVWFLDGNPIVGYSKEKRGVRLMFWSGASFEEEKLEVREGKFKDASIFYNDAREIGSKDLKRWLKKSEKIQWDYKNIIKRKGKLMRKQNNPGNK